WCSYIASTNTQPPKLTKTSQRKQSRFYSPTLRRFWPSTRTFSRWWRSCCSLTLTLTMKSAAASCTLGAVSRFTMNTAGIMRRPRGCCWSSTRQGASEHAY
ncbi:hypothetical protein AMECASPLE_023592, partial [Ameca splendens]